VTTTPQTPIPELQDGRDLLTVPPDDPEANARAVLRLVEDPALAARLRANARERSLLYRWENIAARHLSLYKALAGLAIASRRTDNQPL